MIYLVYTLPLTKTFASSTYEPTSMKMSLIRFFALPNILSGEGIALTDFVIRSGMVGVSEVIALFSGGLLSPISPDIMLHH